MRGSNDADGFQLMGKKLVITTPFFVFKRGCLCTQRRSDYMIAWQMYAAGAALLSRGFMPLRRSKYRDSLVHLNRQVRYLGGIDSPGS